MYTRVFWGLEHVHSAMCIDDACSDGAYVHIKAMYENRCLFLGTPFAECFTSSCLPTQIQFLLFCQCTCQARRKQLSFGPAGTN